MVILNSEGYYCWCEYDLTENALRNASAASYVAEVIYGFTLNL